MLLQRDAIVDRPKQINGMTAHSIFSTSMKTLYEDETLGIKLRKLRDDMRNGASCGVPKDILSLSTGFVLSASEGKTLEYDQWCRLIPRILEKTMGYSQLSEKIRQVYEDSLVALKKRQDQAEMRKCRG